MPEYRTVALMHSTSRADADEYAAKVRDSFPNRRAVGIQIRRVTRHFRYAGKRMDIYVVHVRRPVEPGEREEAV